MLSPEQINEIHRLHFVEKWPQRRIARHLHIGRHTLAKYLDTPAPSPSHRDRTSKLDAFKPAVAELLQQDPHAPAGKSSPPRNVWAPTLRKPDLSTRR